MKHRGTSCDRPEWLSFLDGAPDTLAYHLKHPEITASTYSEAQKIALGEKVLQKPRIYLDQKYWNYCRDAKRGVPQKPIHLDILEALQEVVVSGRGICPVAYPVLEETFKQEDPTSRLITAEVIDELCRNVAIQPFGWLMNTEVVHYLRSRIHGLDLVYPLSQLVWTYPSWIAGEQTFDTTAYDAVTLNAMRKAFLDASTHAPFSALVKALRHHAMPHLVFEDSKYLGEEADRLAQHQDEFNTFEDVFLIEVRGVLDGMSEQLRDIAAHLREDTKDITPASDVKAALCSAQELATFILRDFERDNVGKELPAVRVLGGLHAAIRHRHQVFERGDFLDYMHAQGALPYCQVFLTERKLANLLTHPPLQYDKDYECEVLWKEQDVLAVLKAL